MNRNRPPASETLLLTLLLCISATCAQAQGNNSMLGHGGGPVKSRAQREAEYETHINKMLSGKPLGEIDHFNIDARVLDSLLRSLSPYERYLYCHGRPSFYMQNCAAGFEEEDADEQGADEAHAVSAHSADTKPKLYGYLPSDAMLMHDQLQLDLLAENRAGTLTFIKEDVRRFGILTTHQKEVLVHLNAVELIPWMVDYFKRTTKQQDTDVLVLFLQLMRDNRYPPFMASKTYAKVYGNGRDHTGFIHLNQPNIDLTIERAMGLYQASGR